ncbi:MAG: NADH-quinone oxidoreductase subunit C [Acidimicrobiales bacterium]
MDCWIRVATDGWLQAAQVARHELNYRYIDFVSVIDWMPSPYGRDMDTEQDRDPNAVADVEAMQHGVTGGDTRMQAIGRVHSLITNIGVNIKCDIPDDTLTLDSWISVFGGVNWHEREAYEMFGVAFTGHPGLRHLYLPGDFEGNPMRKDFPLLARRVKPWSSPCPTQATMGEASRNGPHPIPTTGLHRRSSCRRSRQCRARNRRRHGPQPRTPAPRHPRHSTNRRQTGRRVGH